jgi:hypothetical protein
MYYDDINGNGRQDRGERVGGDFIHTTPWDEADVMRNRDVHLGVSHGCIHVNPVDIDQMISRGYLSRNNVIQVHEYDALDFDWTLPVEEGVAPFELAFYPGSWRLYVFGWSE